MSGRREPRLPFLKPFAVKRIHAYVMNNRCPERLNDRCLDAISWLQLRPGNQSARARRQISTVKLVGRRYNKYNTCVADRAQRMGDMAMSGCRNTRWEANPPKEYHSLAAAKQWAKFRWLLHSGIRASSFSKRKASFGQAVFFFFFFIFYVHVQPLGYDRPWPSCCMSWYS